MSFLIFHFSDWLTPVRFGWCRLLTRRNSWLHTSSQLWLQVSRCYEGQPPPQLITLHGCRACSIQQRNAKTGDCGLFLTRAAMTWCLQRCFAFGWEQHAILQPLTSQWLPDDARQHAIGHILKRDGHRCLCLHGRCTVRMQNGRMLQWPYMMLTHCWRHPALGELMTQPQTHRIFGSLVWSFFLCWHNVGIFGYSLASCSAPC